MGLPRFLVSSLGDAGQEVSLPLGEARHATRVLRLGMGARVIVFDGSGREFVATVRAAARERVTLRLEEPLPPQPAPRVPIVLAQAILKGDKMDDVVRDATMLGVSGIVPLLSDHVSVKPAAVKRGAPEERWRRIAIASVKQCGRSTIPEVEGVVPFAEWLTRTPGASATLLLVEPGVRSGRVQSLRSFLAGTPPPRAAVVVGPEGGWSASEIESAVAAGSVPISLGALTLRADAVGLVVLSALTVAWGV